MSQPVTTTPSSSTTSGTASSSPAPADAASTEIINNPISAVQPSQQPPPPPQQEPQYQSLEEAVAECKRLTAKRDQLLKEKAKTDKEIERITKNTRLQTLKTLVPPELFHRSDLYEQELEKVYSWKGLTDDDIRDIYQAKLRNIDLGRARALKQHSASTGAGVHHTTIFDNFRSFRDVPNFNSAALDQEKAEASERVKKSYNLLKRIVGSRPRS